SEAGCARSRSPPRPCRPPRRASRGAPARWARSSTSGSGGPPSPRCPRSVSPGSATPRCATPRAASWGACSAGARRPPEAMGAAPPWEFWIDRGGTFADVIGRAPEGRLHVLKLLSSDDAPAEGVRRVLAAAGHPEGAPLPPCVVKLGTTVATNALLERRGARTLLVANRGLGDVLAIGTQERPDLFALRIEKPPPLHAGTVEAAGRVGADGTLLEPVDEPALRAALAAARADR